MLNSLNLLSIETFFKADSEDVADWAAAPVGDAALDGSILTPAPNVLPVCFGALETPDALVPGFVVAATWHPPLLHGADEFCVALFKDGFPAAETRL